MDPNVRNQNDETSRAWYQFAVRGGVVGAIAVGIAGGVVGLILGLRAYPPTAFFAVFEVGIPALAAGGLLGAIVGALIWVARTLVR